MEKEEELCKALSNFSITLNEFSMKRQLIKPPKLQVSVEKDPICFTFCPYLGAFSEVSRGADFARRRPHP